MEDKRIWKDLKADCVRWEKKVRDSAFEMQCARDEERVRLTRRQALDHVERHLKDMDALAALEARRDAALQAYYAALPDGRAEKKEVARLQKDWAAEVARRARAGRDLEKQHKIEIEQELARMHRRQNDIAGPHWALIRARGRAYEALVQHELLMRHDDARKADDIRVSAHVLKSNMDDACAICCETHLVRDSVLTSCKHAFGRLCFQTWSRSCAARSTPTSCPLCKHTLPLLHSFTLSNLCN